MIGLDFLQHAVGEAAEAGVEGDVDAVERVGVPGGIQGDDVVVGDNGDVFVSDDPAKIGKSEFLDINGLLAVS